ncbi:MAG TPA: hypothetical protein VG389_05455 [Myxococcota bacterium]|jgi:hypothetical protein|nr:hypothetical protein [Myxococcota bacterium]
MKRDREFWSELRRSLFPTYERATFNADKTEAGNFVPLPKLMRVFAAVLEHTTLRTLIGVMCRMDGPSQLAEIDLDELCLDAGVSRVSNLKPHLERLEEVRFIVTRLGRGPKKIYVLLLHPFLAAESLRDRGYFDERQLNALNELLLAMKWEPLAHGPGGSEGVTLGARAKKRRWERPAIDSPPGGSA